MAELPRSRTLDRSLKRLLDVTLAGTALIAASPLLLPIALGIRLTMGSPVLFRQQRPGHHGRPFELLKFRSMSEARDEDGELLPPYRRMTWLGSLLRRTSLDEAPELWNIVKGDMSLVGPRPLLLEYLSLYSAEQARRHDVPPGLTGLAQVKGRHSVSWPDKLASDVWYVDHWSLRLDARILLATPRMLLRGDARAVPTFFTGNEPVHDLTAPVPAAPASGHLDA